MGLQAIFDIISGWLQLVGWSRFMSGNRVVKTLALLYMASSIAFEYTQWFGVNV